MWEYRRQLILGSAVAIIIALSLGFGLYYLQPNSIQTTTTSSSSSVTVIGTSQFHFISTTTTTSTLVLTSAANTSSMSTNLPFFMQSPILANNTLILLVKNLGNSSSSMVLDSVSVYGPQSSSPSGSSPPVVKIVEFYVLSNGTLLPVSQNPPPANSSSIGDVLPAHQPGSVGLGYSGSISMLNGTSIVSGQQYVLALSGSFGSEYVVVTATSCANAGANSTASCSKN